jgi:hypothetical protein
MRFLGNRGSTSLLGSGKSGPLVTFSRALLCTSTCMCGLYSCFESIVSLLCHELCIPSGRATEQYRTNELRNGTGRKETKHISTSSLQ